MAARAVNLGSTVDERHPCILIAIHDVPGLVVEGDLISPVLPWVNSAGFPKLGARVAVPDSGSWHVCAQAAKESLS